MEAERAAGLALTQKKAPATGPGLENEGSCYDVQSR
jgi:hypothetical protein